MRPINQTPYQDFTITSNASTESDNKSNDAVTNINSDHIHNIIDDEEISHNSDDSLDYTENYGPSNQGSIESENMDINKPFKELNFKKNSSSKKYYPYAEYTLQGYTDLPDKSESAVSLQDFHESSQPCSSSSAYNELHEKPLNHVNSPKVTSKPINNCNPTPIPMPNIELDYNGRKPRQWTNRKYRCSHCDELFFDRDLERYAQHIEQVENQKEGILLTRRKFKCPEESCPWHRIGFFRKLEAQKHFDRKHGIPQFECRFWSPDGEKYPGCGKCTTRWHADSGNRARHEQAVHKTGHTFRTSERFNQ